MSPQDTQGAADPEPPTSGNILNDPGLNGERVKTSTPNRGAILDRVGLIASVAFHAILIVWAVGLFASAQRVPEDETIPIFLVPAEADPELLRSPAEAPVSKPEPKAASQRESESAQSQSAKTAEDVNPAEGPAANADQKPAGSDLFAPFGMGTYGRPTTLTEHELDAMRAQTKRCWRIPNGWSEPRQVSVTVRFRLNRDGTVNGMPGVVEFPASELGKAAAEAAVHAVLQCSPFDLPADKYEEWKDVQLRFEP